MNRTDSPSSILPRWLPIPAWVGLAGGALLLGVALAWLPPLWAAIGLITVVLVVATLADPLVGLCAALVLGPTKPLTDYFVPALPLDLGQIALIVTLGAWFLHAVRQSENIRLPRSPLNMPLYIWLGAMLLSLPGALSLGYALKELIKWGQLLLVMWLVLDLDGRTRWKTVLSVALAAATAEALVGVWQFGLRGDGPEHFLILDGRFYRAYGTFEQPNPYAGFLGLLLPVALALAFGGLTRWIRPVWDTVRAQRPVSMRRVLPALFNQQGRTLAGFGLLAGLLLAALLMSWSRGAWMGLAAAGVVVIFAWPRRWWVGIGLVLIGGALGLVAFQAGLVPASITNRLTDFTAFLGTFDARGVDINDANYAVIERLAHWQAAQEMARYRFWFGVGIGNYEPVYPAYALMNWPAPLGHAHNFYLNLLAEVGIIGLLAYGLLWGSVLIKTWWLTRNASGWARPVAIGLLGTWIHLTVHHLVDKLYVANLHLHIGALFGVLTVLMWLETENES